MTQIDFSNKNFNISHLVLLFEFFPSCYSIFAVPHCLVVFVRFDADYVPRFSMFYSPSTSRGGRFGNVDPRNRSFVCVFAYGSRIIVVGFRGVQGRNVTENQVLGGFS